MRTGSWEVLFDKLYEAMISCGTWLTNEDAAIVVIRSSGKDNKFRPTAVNLRLGFPDGDIPKRIDKRRLLGFFSSKKESHQKILQQELLLHY